MTWKSVDRGETKDAARVPTNPREIGAADTNIIYSIHTVQTVIINQELFFFFKSGLTDAFRQVVRKKVLFINSRVWP